MDILKDSLASKMDISIFNIKKKLIDYNHMVDEGKRVTSALVPPSTKKN